MTSEMLNTVNKNLEETLNELNSHCEKQAVLSEQMFNAKPSSEKFQAALEEHSSSYPKYHELMDKLYNLVAEKAHLYYPDHEDFDIWIATNRTGVETIAINGVLVHSA